MSGTAEEWKSKAAEELTLPSGMVVRARRPGPLQVAEWRRLPMQLAAVASGDSATAEQDLAEVAKYIREIVSWCCVEPRVPEEIKPEDIPGEDLTYIWRWALRVEEARALEGFRGERGNGGVGSDSADVRPAAERSSGDLGPSGGIEF